MAIIALKTAILAQIPVPIPTRVLKWITQVQNFIRNLGFPVQVPIRVPSLFVLCDFLFSDINISESRRGKVFRKNNSRNRLFPAPPSIQKTNFDCANYEFPGLYADTEANCEVSDFTILNKTKDWVLVQNTTLAIRVKLLKLFVKSKITLFIVILG